MPQQIMTLVVLKQKAQLFVLGARCASSVEAICCMPRTYRLISPPFHKSIRSSESHVSRPTYSTCSSTSSSSWCSCLDLHWSHVGSAAGQGRSSRRVTSLLQSDIGLTPPVRPVNRHAPVGGEKQWVPQPGDRLPAWGTGIRVEWVLDGPPAPGA